jgi:predicted MFS family arabinose efflux permease
LAAFNVGIGGLLAPTTGIRGTTLAAALLTAAALATALTERTTWRRGAHPGRPEPA